MIYNLSSFIQLKSDIINSHNLVDFFNFNLNINIRSEGSCISAPSFIRSNDRNPSFAVYSDHAFDFATLHSYNILDIYALSHFGSSDFNNILKAAEALSGKSLPRFNSSPNSPDPFVSQSSAFSSLINHFHRLLLEQNPIINPNGQDIHALDYFASRRISLDTIKTLKIGYVPDNNDSADLRYMKNRLLFPYFLYDHEYPVYANGRAASPCSEGFPKYKKLSLNDDRFSLILKNCIWGIDSQHPGRIIKDKHINPDTGLEETLETHHVKYDYLVIAEGVFDALSFWQEGYNVASSLGCGFSQEQKKQLIQICRHFTDKGQKVFLCLDNDKAGDQGQYNLALLLFKNRIPFVVGKLPVSITVSLEGRPDYGQEVSVKDVSDYYSAGGELYELILNAIPGVAFLAQHCKNEDELDTLFQDTAKFASKSDLFKLKQAACAVMDDNGEVEYIDKKTGEVRTVMDKKPRFNKSSVGFYYAMASQPLMDSVIADLTRKAHNLMYDTAGQFYEYRSGVWRAVHDLVVQRYVSEAMNGKLSANKLASVCKYLKASLAIQNLRFNYKPLWCFPNGTLWIDEPDGIGDITVNKDGTTSIRTEPRNLKPSEPDDMSTIQLTFNYKHGAVNETWLRYICEWMNGQEDKITLLQQMAGYVFYASNTLQKFFYFIGDGANGKSTFLHALEGVFGKENCSSLQFHRFHSEFDAIALKNSRLNICYDARTELGGAEDVLKAITSGDAIMAAHKGVDAEAFTTNAKVFVAANRYFSASDVSKGLLRRILFVCFDQDFSGEGQKTNIDEEIRNDPGGLAGVFNWAYDGYKMLKASGKFVETEEQKRLVEEFKAQLSPLMVFARDEMYTRSGCAIDEKDLYAMYSEWAVENGEKRISRTKFIYEIRQVLRTDDSAIKADRDKQSGLWTFSFPFRSGQDDSGKESNEKVQSSEAPADEGSADVYTGVLPSDAGRKDAEPRKNSKALQENSRKVKHQASDIDPVNDPEYIHTKNPFNGWSNKDIWYYGWKCADYLSKSGSEWRTLARKLVTQYRVYAAISAYGNRKSKRDFFSRLLPGFWDFLRDEILPNYDIADDEFGTMTPIKKEGE